MTVRLTPLISLLLLAAAAFGQQEGIGDGTFPKLGNRGYKASHYSLIIRYDVDKNLLNSDVKMDAIADQDLSDFSLDFSGFDIVSVKLNGDVVKFDRSDAKLRIYPKKAVTKGTKFFLETVYSGSPLQQQSAALPSGMLSGWIHYKGGAVVVCEPELAHTWFPCNDHPLNKATFDFDITCTQPFVCVANGVATGASGHTAHFKLDRQGTTCMATVVFGQFGTIKTLGPNNIPITNYVPLGDEDKYRKRLEVSAKFMKYLADRIGPYPFSSYGTVILPPQVSSVNSLMSGAAIETTTIPIFGPIGATSPETLAHELAHQWMGDCVSVSNWGDDIWWVEGFAQFSEWLYAEMIGGKPAYEQAYSAVTNQIGSQLAGVTPGHLKASDMFGVGSYIGGALTFHALRQDVGDEKFFAVVREFVQKNKYGNGSRADWIQISSQIAGHDMKPLFDKWLSSGASEGK